ncbi:MAG: bifunctional [glutamine synthetase] adenylyltransferase/[glutamine synthetase]-adenylyl-L-tyrosine phosphorylase [Hyphomicrobiaceae bacterium]|nr:bifunctional [glutamine synthetase] adenylyltransferase/[glutamine synthetase]-adenylyl-L-tyrosine phosphorylase [Hyphomicrobiaceae bacterium]
MSELEANLPLHAAIREMPCAPLAAGEAARWRDEFARLRHAAGSGAASEVDERAAVCLDEPRVAELIIGIMAGSPYLAGLIRRDPVRLARLMSRPPGAEFERVRGEMAAAMASCAAMADAMGLLRRFKADVALLTALADIAGAWPVMTVTGTLTATADAALAASTEFLFRAARAKGDWQAPARDGEAIAADSGYIVLAMGKHGAGELNYSSDIDLIVFFGKDRVRLRPGLDAQTFFVRMTRDLVRMMQERTSDGYVFRTDLRLRPDAGATQLAISTDAALVYYESFGQNWERAALIKARPVAGDSAAGAALLSELSPFIWRKYLDFAAIADIHAMKRQIHAFRGLGGIGLAGHNVKLGRGGIREIEFFAQTQQLIAGGRQHDLRVRPTLEALHKLVERGWIKPGVRDSLAASYLFLRRIEHRLQMVADEQTHELPREPERLEAFARFVGYPDAAGLSAALVPVLESVSQHYSVLFEDMPELTARGINMVFAGQDDDPDTVAALRAMGFSQPSAVIATVRGWHHGRYAAVRSARSRELLTEVQPLLIEALAETADPDAAFTMFDRFLAELPTGVQLFSLLRANPALLRLVADIMGSAPRLARVLSRRRRLLDAVIDPRTFATLPDAAEVDAIVTAELKRARDFQETLDVARVIGSEQAFLIGVRVLSGQIDASRAGEAYAVLAERLIAALLAAVERELIAANGRVPGGAACVVALGKLGGREMTASSDLDLILVYDHPPDVEASDGPRPLSATHYYARLTQRLISALGSPTAEGTLYEVDMRLRPSGQQGPVATRLSSFVRYHEESAWTWEHMALTRARVVAGEPALASRIEAAIAETLRAPRDRARIAADVRDMRERIAAEKGSDDIWNLKQVRGGLVDLEFIVQFLQLASAAHQPDILDQNTAAALVKLRDRGLLTAEAADELIPACRLVHDLTQVLRICAEGPFDPAAAPRGLQEVLARAGGEPAFATLATRLRATLAAVAALFPRIVR